jgi:DNA-binding HxlR family transcriptional regulator
MNEDRLADYEPGSPTRLALDVLSHKWTLLIVLALKSGPQRFTRLRSLAPGLSSQVLTDSLRELERDGIVVRRRFNEVSPHAAYGLTPLGETLCEPARAIRGWAERNGPAIIAARKRYDGTDAGQPPVLPP